MPHRDSDREGNGAVVSLGDFGSHDACDAFRCKQNNLQAQFQVDLGQSPFPGTKFCSRNLML